MKTTLGRKAALAVALVLSATAGIYAGPNPQSWANLNHTPASADNFNPAPAIPVCPGSKEVALTVMKPSWPNGRGPLTAVQIGTKRVCTVCPVTTATTEGWANGRGPKTSTATAHTGAPHTCTVNCPATKA